VPCNLQCRLREVTMTRNWLSNAHYYLLRVPYHPPWSRVWARGSFTGIHERESWIDLDNGIWITNFKLLADHTSLLPCAYFFGPLLEYSRLGSYRYLVPVFYFQPAHSFSRQACADTLSGAMSCLRLFWKIHASLRPFLFSSVCPLPVPVLRLALESGIHREAINPLDKRARASEW
jgi:hypothetical protein